MELINFTYLALLSILLIIPVVLKIWRNKVFVSKFKYLVPAILVTGFMFLFWDIKFTKVGIWSFSEQYILGLFMNGLPFEQWLFYLLVPFVSLSVYESLPESLNTHKLNNVFVAVSLVLLVAFGYISYQYHMRYYTFFCFLFTTVYLAYSIFRRQFKAHLCHFYLSYLIMLVPYLIISGVLTWLSAIWYQQDQTLNIWIFMVPIENLVYLFLFLLMNTTIYEYLAERKLF